MREGIVMGNTWDQCCRTGQKPPADETWLDWQETLSGLTKEGAFDMSAVQANLRRLFEVADVDESGTLSVQEIKAMSVGEQENHVSFKNLCRAKGVLESLTLMKRTVEHGDGGPSTVPVLAEVEPNRTPR